MFDYRNTDATGQPLDDRRTYLAEVNGEDTIIRVSKWESGWMFRAAEGADDGNWSPVSDLPFRPFPKVSR